MTEQIHNGNGDNVAGNKIVNINVNDNKRPSIFMPIPYVSIRSVNMKKIPLVRIKITNVGNSTANDFKLFFFLVLKDNSKVFHHIPISGNIDQSCSADCEINQDIIEPGKEKDFYIIVKIHFIDQNTNVSYLQLKYYQFKSNKLIDYIGDRAELNKTVNNYLSKQQPVFNLDTLR